MLIGVQIDILIIYGQRKTNMEEILIEFNEKQLTMKFTIENELHNSINFLNLSVHCRGKKLELVIYRKLTQTYIIIPNDFAIHTNIIYPVSIA
jgi:hypothetical protein